MKTEASLQDMLGDPNKTWDGVAYDWGEVFKYGTPEPVLNGDSAPLAAFSLCDVAEILGSANGENDGDDWIAVGRLKDGRFFAVRAWCDYTGWD
jgi:hypothetical protein